MIQNPPVAEPDTLPDMMQVVRCRRAPTRGPRILFFTGGSALRDTSRYLKLLTHNSVHLVTAFDSGGSSAMLREHFGMLSVGDVRNRLMALADETARGNPDVVRLFSHRLDEDGSQREFEATIDAMVAGLHPLVSCIPEPMRSLATSLLGEFRRRMPSAFDLRGASVGNLVLAGGHLRPGSDLHAVIRIFSECLAVRGRVLPITLENLHLVASLEDGAEVVGQHRFTGKSEDPLGFRVTGLSLVRSLEDPAPVAVPVTREVESHIEDAELICFPVGSFWSSVVANLLPAGVGRAIRASGAPKVYVPNPGSDPEENGMSVLDCARTLKAHVERDVGRPVEWDCVLDVVLVDTARGAYGERLDIDALEARGLRVIDTDFVWDDGRVNPQRLAELLVSVLSP